MSNIFLVRTSIDTHDNVIHNRKHAFHHNLPGPGGAPGDFLLISKNRNGLPRGEKQISYIARLDKLRDMVTGEEESYWPGNLGRWNIIAEFSGLEETVPFDLADVLGKEESKRYQNVSNMKLEEHHAKTIRERLRTEINRLERPAKFPYTVQVRSDDLRVVSAMRGVAANIIPRDSWSGTGKANWEKDDHRVTFRFARSEQRDRFVRDLHEIINPGLFSLF